MEISKKKDGYFYFGKGFTLIELLVVIALIGILASIVLVMMSSMKDSARQKAAYSAARSAQARLLQCLTVDKAAMLCYRGTGSINCRGNLNINSVPGENQPICATDWTNTATYSTEKWKELPTDYIYGDTATNDGAACSSLYGGGPEGAFNFNVYKRGATTNDYIFCCTQQGCKELKIMNYSMAGHVNSCAGASTDLKKTLCKCKEEAGMKSVGAGNCQ